MTVKDLIYQICNDQGISFSQCAKNIGVSKGSLWNQMDHDNGMRIKIGTLVKDLEALGYQLVVVDSESDEEYILNGEDEDVVLDTSRRAEKW